MAKKVIKEKKHEKKVGKKTNEDAILIKRLLSQNYRPIDIANKFNISKQKINYWKKTEIKETIHRRNKLDEKNIQEIIKMAENQTTSNMGSRKIAAIMNEKFKKEGRNIRISRTTVCKYLKKYYGAPRKMKKLFSINGKKKEERMKFCQKVLDLKLKGKDIFFTDESIMDCNPFVNEHIRLSPENTQKLKKGDIEALNLLNKDAEKYPKKILIAGGISFYGLSDLIIVEGTMTDFAYGQTLLHYKKNFDEFKLKNKNLIFEQDRASTHTSKANTILANALFGEEQWILCPPNSPDLAYPIESLWANLKKNVKNRNPKNYEELKSFCIEEWNKINPKNYLKNFIKRVKMVLDIKGDRLDTWHLEKIRREEEEEEEAEEDEEEDIDEEIEFPKRTLKRVFNEAYLYNLKRREIASLKKKKKEMNKNYKEKIDKNKTKKIKTKKNMADEIKEDINDTTFLERNILGNAKEYDKKLFEKKIKKLEDYSLEEYLKYYLKKEEKKQEEEEKKKQKKKKSKDDDELRDEKIDEIMEIEREFGKEVEKEMMNEEISEEETKIDLNEENMDIIDKIFKLKKLEKEKNFTYILNADFKKKRRRKKKINGK